MRRKITGFFQVRRMTAEHLSDLNPSAPTNAASMEFRTIDDLKRRTDASREFGLRNSGTFTVVPYGIRI